MKRFTWMVIPPVFLLVVLCAAAETPTISANWIDFQVEILGKVYALPCPVADFLADGWTATALDETLSPGRYELSTPMYQGDIEIYVQIVNLGIDELPKSECLVGQVSVDAWQANNGARIAVAGGITIGDSIDAVEATIGPGTGRESAYALSYKYESSGNNSLEVVFDAETKTVNKLSVRSFDTPQGYNDEALAAPCDVPEAVLAYQPPDALGDDLLAFTACIDGALYAMPVPVRYMQANGWSLGDKDNKKIPAWDTSFGRSVTHSGYTIRTQLYNGSPKANVPENCFVTTLRFEQDMPLAVELPHGIKPGMSRESLEKALEGYEAEQTDLSSSVSYKIRSAQLQEIAIVLSKDTDTVRTIELSYIP